MVERVNSEILVSDYSYKIKYFKDCRYYNALIFKLVGILVITE